MGHAPDSPANVHVAQTRMTPGVRNQLKDVNGLQVVACVILAAFYQNVALGAGEQFLRSHRGWQHRGTSAVGLGLPACDPAVKFC